MITVKNVSKSFGEGDKKIVVLDQLNAHFPKGKITCIIEFGLDH